MSKGQVMGKDVRVYVYRDVAGVPTPVQASCGTEWTKDEAAEEINVRRNTSRYRSYIGGYKDATATLSLLVTLDELNRWQYLDWINHVGEVVRMLITYENAYGDRLSYDAEWLVTGVSDSAPSTDFVTFQVSILRSGEPTITLLIDGLRDSDGELILDSDGLPIR